MSYKKRVLIVGGSNMELTLNVMRLPDKGESLKDDGGASFSAGGGVANAAVALSKLGAEVVLTTKLGMDLYGQKLYSYYKSAGINTSLIKVDRDFATGLTVSLKEADGSSRKINFPGANDHLGEDAISEGFSSSPDALYVNFESSVNLALKCAKIAEARKVPIFIDASPADANIPLERFPEAEIFSLGEAETQRYTGIKPLGSQESLRAAFALWRKVHAKYIVINQGVRGAMIYDGKRCEIVSPTIVKRAVDMKAANDAFTAALTLEYLRIRDIKAAVKYAIAAAAITVSRYGSSSSVPTREEIESEMAKEL